MVAGRVSGGARQNDNYYLTQITQITLIYGSVLDLKIYQKSERKFLEHESHKLTRIISYRCFVSYNLSVYENKFSTHLCYTKPLLTSNIVFVNTRICKRVINIYRDDETSESLVRDLSV